MSKKLINSKYASKTRQIIRRYVIFWLSKVDLFSSLIKGRLMMKSKSILLDKRICVYIIFIIISIIVLNSKKNYHVDELYSYSLANHDGDLNIEIEDGKEYEPADSPFISHLTLSPKNILNYEMVWENQIRDVHPPLYYCLVHFVSSFTPNYFTKWTAGIINIIF